MGILALVDSTHLNDNLEDIADAIRTKGGTSSSLSFPQGFIDAVNAIPTGGGGITVQKGAVSLTNNRGSQIGCNRIRMEVYTGSYLDAYNSNIANGSTLTENSMAIFTDSNNVDFFIMHSTANNLAFSYNGNPLTSSKTGVSGQYNYIVYLPSGFDNSYPIIIT